MEASLAGTPVAPATDSINEPRHERTWSRWPVLPALLAILLGIVWLVFLLWPRPPADDSADAGFARDMSRHHEQAVAMASVVYQRTDDPVIRSLAYDVLTTQQGQIGIMSGWLDIWGLPATGPDRPMAWMGHPVDGPMPGMAAGDEVASLQALPPDQADTTFLRLMTRHHQGGMVMAEAAVVEADRSQVRALARGIASAQRAEIVQMQEMLAQRGLPPVPDLTTADEGMAGMDEMLTETEVHGGHVEGFTAGFGDVLRRAVAYLPLSIALFALGWLVIDALNDGAEVDAVTGTPPPAQWIAVAALLATAALHAGLAPEHFDERTSYGLFFAGSTVAAAVIAAAIVAWPARAAYLAGAAISLLLIALWALFRLVPPPGANETEAVDLIGLLTKALELAAFFACMLLWRQNTRRAAVEEGARRS
jgi:uncharacterized protein (DUF305 family)